MSRGGTEIDCDKICPCCEEDKRVKVPEENRYFIAATERRGCFHCLAPEQFPRDIAAQGDAAERLGNLFAGDTDGRYAKVMDVASKKLATLFTIGWLWFFLGLAFVLVFMANIAGLIKLGNFFKSEFLLFIFFVVMLGSYLRCRCKFQSDIEKAAKSEWGATLPDGTGFYSMSICGQSSTGEDIEDRACCGMFQGPPPALIIELPVQMVPVGQGASSAVGVEPISTGHVIEGRGGELDHEVG